MSFARRRTTAAFLAAAPALLRSSPTTALSRRHAAHLRPRRKHTVRAAMSGAAVQTGGAGGGESVADLRVSYSASTVGDDELTTCPIALFERWMAEARAAGTAEANAMTLATADARGRPSARVVLLKGVDARGFAWYTNYGSRKAAQLAENPYAALTFWWPEIERSVRVEGVVARVPAAESDAYFASRPAESRLGAWASDQSRPLDARETLQTRWEELKARHLGGDGAGTEGEVAKAIERPPFWGGFRLVPARIEFWKGRHARLHDRVLYERELPERAADELVCDGAAVADGWARSRLQP